MRHQGERIQSFFGVGPDLLANPPLRCFNATITCEDSRGKCHQKIVQLDVTELGSDHEGLGQARRR